MSYAGTAALQSAIFGHLSAVPDLAGVAIVDAMPAGGGTGTFILLGPEEALDQSDATGAGAEHRVVISVISDATGFLVAKSVAVVISDALIGADLVLNRGQLVGLGFIKGVARRLEDGEVRRIDLTFRARIEI